MADEKTRILTPAERQRLRLQRPRVAGDKVVFHCGNGHRIVAPVKNVGMTGVCSTCQTPVRVPAVEPGGVEPTGEMPGSPAVTRILDAGGGGRGSAAPAPTPGRVAGAPPAGPPVDHDPLAPVESGPAGAAGEWGFFGGTAPVAEAAVAAGASWSEPQGDEGFAADGDNPTAVLLSRLWEEQQHGGLVQVHLKDGGLILPQEYAARWSQGTHAVFASSEADGSITLTAVAWDAIQKIVVRNLKDGLPPGMFD